MRLGVERLSVPHQSTTAPSCMAASGGWQNMSYDKTRQSISKCRRMASRAGSMNSPGVMPLVSGWRRAMSFFQTSGVARKSVGTRSGSSCRRDRRTRSRGLRFPIVVLRSSGFAQLYRNIAMFARRGVGDEGFEFVERAGVEQEVKPLASGQLAPGALSGEAFCAAALQGFGADGAELEEARIVHRSSARAGTRAGAQACPYGDAGSRSCS